ncbi:MAG: hypothetical protein MJZ26_09155 [Fibrobacter sp.]|nr:hypothetical protein [Fibrobacter sp.]
MSVSGGIISRTDTITRADVKTAIQASTNNLTELCKHANVKPCSRYKPVRKKQDTGMTEADFASVDYGYLYPSLLTAQELCNFLAGISTASGKNLTRSGSDLVAIKNGWYYQKPSGGADSPCRIGDFRGYNNNVGNNLMLFESFDSINVAQPPAQTRIPFSVYCPYGESQVLPWEMGSMNNTGKVDSNKRYFGIVVYKVGATITARSNPRYLVSGSNNELMIESTSSLSAGAKLCKLFDGSGTYWIIPVMSSSKEAFNDGTTASGATANQQAIFYPLPCAHQVCVATNSTSVVVPPISTDVVWTTTITATRTSRRINITMTLSGRLKKAGSSVSIGGWGIYSVVSARQGQNDYISTPKIITANKLASTITSATADTIVYNGITGLAFDYLDAGFNTTDPITISVLCQTMNEGKYFDLQNSSNEVTK